MVNGVGRVGACHICSCDCDRAIYHPAIMFRVIRYTSNIMSLFLCCDLDVLPSCDVLFHSYDMT